MDDKEKELQSMVECLNLKDIEEARKVSYIINELEEMGDWGNKVLSYFIPMISCGGEKSFIPSKMIEAYKSLFRFNIEEDGGKSGREDNSD